MGCIKEADSSDYRATEAIEAAESQTNQDADGDPVNMVTGAFILTEHDLSIPTRRLNIDLTRHYNNQLHDSDSKATVRGFGRGWSHSLDLHLEPGPGPGEITYVDDRGTRVVFTIAPDEFVISEGILTFQWTTDSNVIIKRSGKVMGTFGAYSKLLNVKNNNEDIESASEPEIKVGPGLFQITYLESEKQAAIFEIPKSKCCFTPPAGALALELTIQKNGEINLRQVDGLSVIFDPTGKLKKIVRPGPKSNSEVDISYDPFGRLKTASDSTGRRIEFDYQGESNLIHAVSDHTNRRWVYQYNEHQELVEVNDPLNRMRRYSYQEWTGTITTGKGKITSSKIRAMNKIFPFTEKSTNQKLQPEIINQYTSDRRVVRQKNALGHLTRFDYNRFTYTTYMTDPAGWTTVYAFNANGNTTKVRKPCGGTREFIYDDRDNLIAEIDEVGNTTQYVDIKDVRRLAAAKDFGQRANGNRSAYVTLHENEIVLGYDSLGNRPLVRDALGNVTRFFEYNHFGRPKRIDLPNGSTVFYEFDERSGLPLRTEKVSGIGKLEPLTQVQEWKYDDFGNPTRYEEYALGQQGPAGPKRVVVVEYDLSGNHPITRREWVESNGKGEKFSADEKYSWDTLGRLVSKIIFRRNKPDRKFEILTSRFGYDSLDREIWRIDPNNTATCFVRDLKGQVIETYLVSNASTEELPFVPLERRQERKRWQYDELGQQVAFIDPAGAQTLREWNSRGQCIKIIEPMGFTTIFEYDRDGNQIVKMLQTGYEVRTTYDSMGRPVSYSDNLGRCSERTYDALGRIQDLSEGEYDQRNKTEFQYDLLGHLKCIIHPDRTIEKFTFDETNNLVYHDKGSIEKPGQRVEKYTYDTLGRRTAIHAGSNNELHLLFTIEYLDDKRAINVIDAIGSHFQTFYDSTKNVIQKIDGEGRTLKFVYDAMNRLLQRSSDDGAVQSNYKYDALGRLGEAQESSIRYNWHYDRGGRLVRHDQNIGLHSASLRYEYDEAGRLLSKGLDDAWWMRFEYLANTPFVSHIAVPGKNLNVQTDVAGRVIEEVWNDGAQFRYQLSPNGSLIGIESYDEQHQPVFEQQIERDSRGRPIAETRRNPHDEKHLQYIYDDFDQLISIQRLDDGTIKPYRRYVYDDLGNRLEEHREGKLFAKYYYDSANHLIERNEDSGKKTSYKYDRNGNLIQRDNLAFHYDPLQRLRQVSLNIEKSSQIDYQYSPIGDLGIISKREKQEPEIAIYDGFQQIVANKQGKVQRYFWGSSIDTLKAVAEGGQLPQEVYTDDMGSLLAINPNEVWQDYGPYGEKNVMTSESFLFGFCGKRYETDANLYYARARFYDPTSGRFTQPDPLGTYDTLNLYLYAKNNPLAYADPIGLASCRIDSAKDAHGTLGVWPLDPDGLSKELGISPTKDFYSKEHGTRVVEWRSGLVKIRFEAHVTDEGEYNPRHHGAHYHVWIRQPDQGFARKDLEKLTPLGYVKGQGTGFLPGERIPAAVYWGI